LWGKVGRAFLRVISERQYARFPVGDSGFALDVIRKEMQKNWAPRKTQTDPVEMIAPILALHTFRERLYGTDLILLIDSEARRPLYRRESRLENRSGMLAGRARKFR
ncbi:unnamed protein product, partial [Cladocopium goreaui]